MKLAAIFNVWDDWEMLEHSIRNIKDLVDGIIIVGSTKSNFGEFSGIPIGWRDSVVIREPVHHHPSHSETDKRNFGLDLARKAGYTHFITMDADEFYEPIEFRAAKEEFEKNPELQGSVCQTQVYFKSPTLTIGLDITLVPFIHKITPTLKHEFNRKYPFAWEGLQIRIDPTRSLNISSGVQMCNITMHHFSHVRRDYQKKIRNSTARANLERSTIVQDLLNAKEDYFCQFYQKRLVRVPNRFGIPEYGEEGINRLDKDLQSIPSGNPAK